MSRSGQSRWSLIRNRHGWKVWAGPPVDGLDCDEVELDGVPYSQARGRLMPASWPLNRNHEAARRHVNQVLRDHGRPDYRRETEIATLLDELVRERNELREVVYRRGAEGALTPREGGC